MSPEQYRAPHPEPRHAYGPTYGEHREFLEFSLEQHRELKAYCDQVGIGYACSVWDLTSFSEIATLAPDFLKIPSAVNTHEALITRLCREFKGGLHVSLGMTTRAEEARLVALLRAEGRLKDTVLYHCTAGYPVPVEDIYLLEITRLRETYGAEVAGIGFSAHYTGIGLDPAAVCLGAGYIERHFTLDRAWRGTDHAASLEPDGLRRVRKDTRNLARALCRKPEEIVAIERPQRAKLKYRDDGNGQR